MKISVFEKKQTLLFAAEELKKYLALMLGDTQGFEISVGEDKKEGFRLGLMEQFGLDTGDVRRQDLDDILYIDTDEVGGIIAGNNPRSVLLSVYEYLRQNGCRWLFPGRDGEFIPKRKELTRVKYRHVPSFRYRGPCIEGAVSREIVLDTIEFLPKVGMNLFMSQFQIPTVFYNRYYGRGFNNYLEPSKVDRATVAAFKTEFEGEIVKRGLQYHDMGHGWCVLPFGVSGADTWRPEEEITFPEENRRYFAYLDGKRGLRDGKPLQTNFCMSNPEARKIAVDYICRFAKEHKQVTTLHVWLSDGINGHCECEECKQKTASDWYVIFLNELDAALTEQGITTSIAFAMYNDTTFAPTEERLLNEERFSLSMGPIRRIYTETRREGGACRVPAYKRNDITLPASLEEYLAHLDVWRKSFDGACLAFEYHFWRFWILDISGLEIAKRIYEDIDCYRNLSFDGMVACGSQRAYFPNGYAYYTYARALFDSSLSLEEIRRDYFLSAYGAHSERVLEYLERINEAFSYKYMSAQESEDPSVSLYYSPMRAEKLCDVKACAADMRAYLDGIDESESALVKKSLELIREHTDYAEMVADFIKAYALADKETAREKYELFKTEMSKREPRLERYLDHWLAVAYLERPIRTDNVFW